jgi:hypothetical protein
MRTRRHGGRDEPNGSALFRGLAEEKAQLAHRLSEGVLGRHCDQFFRDDYARAQLTRSERWGDVTVGRRWQACREPSTEVKLSPFSDRPLVVT